MSRPNDTNRYLPDSVAMSPRFVAMRAEYDQSLKDAVGVLGQALGSRSWDDAGRTAHRIAGTAANYGLNDLGACACDCVTQLRGENRSSDGDAVARLIGAISAHLAQADAA